VNLAFVVWLALNWNEKPVRQGSPLFLLLINFGVLLVCIAGIFNSIGLDSSAMCALYTFFLLTGITLILACILAKNWRIYQIFSNKKSSAVVLEDKKLLVFPAVLMFVTLIFYFVYIFAGGLIVAAQKSSNSNNYYTYLICESPTSWFQMFMLILFYAYLVVLVAGLAFLSYMTRSVHSRYSKSRYLAIVVYTYICLGVIFIPLYYVQGSSTSSQSIRYILVSINMIILMSVTLFMLFVPLIRTTSLANKQNAARQERMAVN
jgi:hypothetical protein